MNNRNNANQNAGCLASLLNLFKNKPGVPSPVAEASPVEEPDTFPYRVRDDFLSNAEQSFYLVLKGMMGQYFTICPKVSLGDVFFVVRPHENRSAFNRIIRKHIDFLICEPKTMKPLFAIELDDASHERPDRIERDEFVDKVFDAANLPLLHIPVQHSYNTVELGNMFKKVLQRASGSQEIAKPADSPNPSEPVETEQVKRPPVCPKCGVPMVLRTAKNGNQAGRSFYGCPNFPKCRVVLPYEP